MAVYANGLEISCKAQSDKVIAAFPDVCFTPPENPATPPGVPIPYPTFGFDSDTDKGTGTVKIGDETVNQKNKSYYTKTTGTEAGCAAKKGIINSKNTGKKYCRAWSSNVKADKEPVTRFSDITTNNHASTDPPNAPTPQPQVGGVGPGGEADTKCIVGKYDDIVEKCRASGLDKPEKHHIVPDRVYRIGGGDRIPGAPRYGDGINICLSRSNHRGSLADNPKSVHGNLDNALEQFGATANPGRTPNAPTDCEAIEKIRFGCLAALFKLVPDPVSQDCFDLAVKMVTEQTDPIKDKLGRTKKMPITDTSTQNVLRNQG
ncbi:MULTISPECIES: DUF4150 domain-containing protein [Phyllobacteriaceae]|jgi:Domain of unknown function (DUF4150)|uniref:DUF4150 domain-containing protein n=1 Tax=Phyllobacteriaceae TaxID=69277 RepID=UPI000466EAB4|nr:MULTISPECIES: DUF4150 domain-containing protein [Mesorhizobium]MBN9233905.1 DUF4150 domain-containing protein [Mesorhizobium sp.]MDQ0331436.1 hypothetical protein [Mesorhizobium sp. YL-MeA3-2017]